MQESKSCNFTISFTLECKSSAYPRGPLPLPLSYLHRIAMFILPLRLNASVLRQEFTEDFSSARTRTQNSRTRIWREYHFHHVGMNERLFIRTILFDFHHLVTSQTEMSNWEGHKDLLCALSILALSKPIVLIRCGRTRTCDVLKLAGFGDQCSRLCATHLLLETRIGVAPTSSGFADHPLTVWVPRQKCIGCGRIRTHGVPYRNSLDFKSSALNQLSHASIKYVYLPLALITQYTSLRTRYVTISSGYILSSISIVLITCYPRRCCTQSTYRYSKSEPLTWKASVLPLELHVQFYINKWNLKGLVANLWTY